MAKQTVEELCTEIIQICTEDHLHDSKFDMCEDVICAKIRDVIKTMREVKMREAKKLWNAFRSVS